MLRFDLDEMARHISVAGGPDAMSSRAIDRSPPGASSGEVGQARRHPEVLLDLEKMPRLLA